MEELVSLEQILRDAAGGVRTRVSFTRVGGDEVEMIVRNGRQKSVSRKRIDSTFEETEQELRIIINEMARGFGKRCSWDTVH